MSNHFSADNLKFAGDAFTFVFSELEHGKQTGTAYYATDSQARQPEPAGSVLIASSPVGFDASAHRTFTLPRSTGRLPFSGTLISLPERRFC